MDSTLDRHRHGSFARPPLEVRANRSASAPRAAAQRRTWLALGSTFLCCFSKCSFVLTAAARASPDSSSTFTANALTSALSSVRRLFLVAPASAFSACARQSFASASARTPRETTRRTRHRRGREQHKHRTRHNKTGDATRQRNHTSACKHGARPPLPGTERTAAQTRTTQRAERRRRQRSESNDSARLCEPGGKECRHAPDDDAQSSRCEANRPSCAPARGSRRAARAKRKRSPPSDKDTLSPARAKSDRSQQHDAARRGTATTRRHDLAAGADLRSHTWISYLPHPARCSRREPHKRAQPCVGPLVAFFLERPCPLAPRPSRPRAAPEHGPQHGAQLRSPRPKTAPKPAEPSLAPPAHSARDNQAEQGRPEDGLSLTQDYRPARDQNPAPKPAREPGPPNARLARSGLSRPHRTSPTPPNGRPLGP